MVHKEKKPKKTPLGGSLSLFKIYIIITYAELYDFTILHFTILPLNELARIDYYFLLILNV